MNSQAPVLLFGEMLADVFPDKSVIGGAPYNVARHLATLGEHAVLVTRLGKDALGESMRQEMADAGMDMLGVQLDKTHPTGRVIVSLNSGRHHFDVLPRQAYDHINPAIVRLVGRSLNPALVYFGTLAQRQATSAKALRVLLKHTPGKKFLDVNLRAPWYTETVLWESLQWADIVKLNDEELSEIGRLAGIENAEAREIAVKLVEKFNLQEIVVTCGARGAWMTSRDGYFEAVGAPAIEKNAQADTVGAGDGFAAVYLLGKLNGWPMRETLIRAAAFASALCGIRGAIPERMDFYKKFTEAWA
jgi:fructokinase